MMLKLPKIAKNIDYSEALTRTLHAYENFFKNPKKEFKKWKHYGEFSACHVCRAAGVTTIFHTYLCRINSCPLAAVKSYCAPCATKTHDKLLDLFLVLFQEDKELSPKIEARLVKLTKDRYDWIIAKMKKAGYEYR